MLVELSVMEQRYQAVLAVVQDGWKVVEVADRLGVSRQTVHNWIARYEQGGLASLSDRSRRPNACPHQTSAEIEALICELRREHPGWGPRRIEHQLARSGIDPVPGRSSIYRCLKRHGLVELRRRRKRREEFRRWQRERPMQLWQMDVMGGVELDDGTEYKVVTGVDDHSRFCVAAGLVSGATSRAVCEILSASLSRYGIPDEILTDNGKCFTGRFGPHPVEVLFDRILRENGISHRHTGVRSPTTTGKIERFHQSLRREFLAGRTFPSLEAAQAELDAWVADYNTNRPHQALDMATPGERFGLRPVSPDSASVPVDPHEDQAGQWVLRRVASNGIISVDNQMFSVGNAYRAELVDVFVDETTIQVWSKNHLIKTVARSRSGPVRKIRADGLHVKHQPDTKRQASGGNLTGGTDKGADVPKEGYAAVLRTPVQGPLGGGGRSGKARSRAGPPGGHRGEDGQATRRRPAKAQATHQELPGGEPDRPGLPGHEAPVHLPAGLQRPGRGERGPHHPRREDHPGAGRSAPAAPHASRCPGQPRLRPDP